eukprot:gene1970-6564_t
MMQSYFRSRCIQVCGYARTTPFVVFLCVGRRGEGSGLEKDAEGWRLISFNDAAHEECEPALWWKLVERVEGWWSSQQVSNGTSGY